MGAPSKGAKDMLKTLIRRGDQVAIVDGVLQIIPASGASVPDDWLKENNQRLVAEIAQAVRANAYSYDSYSTGRYKNNGLLHSGVTLQFVDIVTGENPHAIFNAELKKAEQPRQVKKVIRYQRADLTLQQTMLFISSGIEQKYNTQEG